jgi:hypothetical protein
MSQKIILKEMNAENVKRLDAEQEAGAATAATNTPLHLL